jgi:hypothetical protein
VGFFRKIGRGLMAISGWLLASSHKAEIVKMMLSLKNSSLFLSFEFKPGS